MHRTTNHNKATKHRGINLIEVICILFVLFLLFSILMPSLSRVKSIATRAVCGSQMKGYGTLFIVYLNDSEDVFPDPEQWMYSKASYSAEHPAGCRWHDWPMAYHGDLMAEHPEFKGMMDELLMDMEISPCPTFRDIAPEMGCENPDHNPDLAIKPQNNRSMNAYLGSGRPGGVKSADRVHKGANVFLLAEENSWSLSPDHLTYPTRWLTAPLSTKALDDTSLLISPTPQAENCFATFHNAIRDPYSDGYANLTFLDGHVSTIKAQDQLRDVMHAGSSSGRSSSIISETYSSYEDQSYTHPGGNLYWAWPLEQPPPGGWEAQ